MKLRWKVTFGIVATSAITAFLLLRADTSEKKACEQTLRTLRAGGFKTDLSEFNFSASKEMRARSAVLTFFGPNIQRPLLPEGDPDFTSPVTSNAIRVAWAESKWLSRAGEDVWPLLRESLDATRPRLDAACDAVISGPIRFDLDATAGYKMLLPHLAALKRLQQTLASRGLLELHDGNTNAAWTNLLAVTRIVTVYDPEASEISHLVRVACATIAYEHTWQALQASGWSDHQLSQLQHEWESANFLQGLPETAAFSRACAVAECELLREQKPQGSGQTWKDIFQSPRNALASYNYYLQQRRYLAHGSYEDERNFLLYFRERETQLQRAVQSSSWQEMQSLPGVTNPTPFLSSHRSPIQALLNVKQISVSMGGQGVGPLARAAEAESRRRLLISAIALERFRMRHGTYPRDLSELAPDFLNHLPLDFMDGKPLRYRLVDGGHFVLYSIGRDCVDNGGVIAQSRRRTTPYGGPPEPRIQTSSDLVWPRPASIIEVQAYQREQIDALARTTDRVEEAEAIAQWKRTADRQAGAAKILATKASGQETDSKRYSRPLNELVRNEQSPATKKIALQELLTLKQIITGNEPEIITFELPLAFDVVTNLGNLALYIDPGTAKDSDDGYEVGWLEQNRSTNGNCLLVWNTIFEAPGLHVLQMGIGLNDPANDKEYFFVGPMAPFTISNLCQFSLSSAYFKPELGATLRAKLPEAIGNYAVKLMSTNGYLLRTFTGNTSNGVIKVHWDLTDEHGKKCTNQVFNSVFDISLPESGRTQTLKGP